jgi:hypothetical protein
MQSDIEVIYGRRASRRSKEGVMETIVAVDSEVDTARTSFS